MRWVDHDGVELLEAELPGAKAAFSCRIGGVSREDFEGLNLGVLTGDRLPDVVENRRRLAAAVEREPDQILCARQVHGAELIDHRHLPRPSLFAEPERFRRPPGDGRDPSGDQATGQLPVPPEADAHATKLGEAAALVFVADCLPIALSGPDGVAMLHGGWRGLAAGIVDRGAAAVRASAAAIGPGIGPCCFEVGHEVLDAFGDLGSGLSEGRMLDLPGVAERLLVRAGVPEGAIQRTEHCTRCEPERFYSHRGQGPDTGRQAGLVWIDA